MKFTEDKLEQAIITLLEEQGYPYHRGDTLSIRRITAITHVYQGRKLEPG
jgi:hypothetical protein